MIASDENILVLGMRADDARRKRAAARVYYQRVHVLEARDVTDGLIIPDAASEARLMDTPASFEEALRLIRAVVLAAGRRPVAAYSLAEIAARVKDGWGDWRTVLTEMAKAGVTDFAEVPADLLSNLDELVAMARSAGFGVQRLTVSHPIGDQKSVLLDRIGRCINALGGVSRINPLPRNAPIDKPTTGYEDVRMVALTRLALHELPGDSSPFVEVDWSLYGPKLAQVALTFGADFLDAVPATSDESLGRRRGTVEDVERNIRAAGFEPQEFRPTA